MPPPDTGPMTVDDRFAYYADATTIRRHQLPATPSNPAPPNDNFENATPLSGDAPLSVTGVLGGATTQPAEETFTPAAPPTRTVWYAFRPTKTERISVTVTGLPVYWAFFTGSALSTLIDLRVSEGPSVYYAGPLPITAGQTYWIEVGTRSAIPDFRTFTLNLRLNPSSTPRELPPARTSRGQGSAPGLPRG